MRKTRGFTLIEILVALTVFAIIATITSSTLYYAFTTRTRVNEQSERLSKLQFAITLLQQDTSQTVERAIRSSDLRLFPIFIGRSHYFELTRDGILNPGSTEQRSTFKRVAYVCQNDSLKRRTWSSLDDVYRNKYEDKLLIDKLNDCHFGFLNQTLEVFPEWRTDAVTQNQKKESLPKAIQINLNLQDSGAFNLLMVIPGALYVPK